MVGKRERIIARAKGVVGRAVHRQNKNYKPIDRLLGFVELMRPLEWSKTLFNMTIGLLIAFYVFNTGASLYLFGAGIAAIFILWSGLYALNDWTDWKSDLAHKSKHIRSIPSGRVTPKQALIFSLLLLIIAFGIGLVLGNALFLFCMSVMVLNQLVYTLKPFRFKDKKVFDIISGAFVNPTFRYLSGLFLFVSLSDLYSVGFPILPVMFVIGIQVGSYLTYRFSSREHDAKLKVNSTVSDISIRRAKIFSRFWILLGAFSMFAIIGNFYFLKSAWLGFVPWHYVLAIIPGLFIAPLLRQIVKSPSKATDPSSYKLVYASFHIASDIVMLLAILIFVFYPFI